MVKKEVKVKSYITKDGKRVKQSRRRIKIAAGVGAVVGLGLAGKKLNKTIQVRREIKGFKPKSDGFAIRDYESGVLENSRQAQIDSLHKSIANTRFELLKVRENQAKNNKTHVLTEPFTKVVSSDLPDPNTIKSNLKRAANSKKVLARRKLLQQVDATVEGDMKPIYLASGKVNKNKSSRKQAGKRLADAAKDLRSRGVY